MPVGTAATVKAMLPQSRARDRRRHPAGQHLSSDAAARRRAHRAAGRPAQVHGLGAADPHRFRRLPGDVAVEACARSRKRACASSRISTACGHFCRPNARWRSSACSAPTSRWCSTNVPPIPRRESRDREIAGAVDALGEALARRRSASSRAAPVSASCRAASSPICASARPRRCSEIGFDGYAVGGLAVGEGQAAMFDTLDATVPHLPADRPRYLMGVGKPDDIVGAVLRGIDMFDCVLPTRSGRNGQAFTRARHAQPAQCAPCRGSGAARRGLPLPGLPPVQPRLSAPHGEGERDHRRDAADLAQSDLLPGPDGEPSGGHIRRAFGAAGRGWSRRPMPAAEKIRIRNAIDPADPDTMVRGLLVGP